MTLVKGKTQHLRFLDGIRGLAALYVVFYHYLSWNTGNVPHILQKSMFWASFGHFSVNVFIVLSGFSLMLTVVKGGGTTLKGGMKDYIRRRARRILPPYYAILILSVVVAGFIFLWHRSSPTSDAFDFSSLIAHLLMIHNINPKWSGGFNMALWSVATEWQIYFIFPLFLLPLWRRYGNVWVIVGGFLLGLTPSLFPFGGDWYVACPWYIGLFATGMIGAVMASRLLTDGEVSSKRNYLSRLGTAALVLLVLFLLATKMSNHFGSNTDSIFNSLLGHYCVQSFKDACAGGIALCLIFYLLLLHQQKERSIYEESILQIFEGKVAVFLAGFSYSLYLTHCLWLDCLMQICSAYQMSSTATFMVRLLIGIPSSLVFAYAFYLVFERPFTAQLNTANREKIK